MKHEMLGTIMKPLHSCVSFPGIDNVKVCMSAGASTGDPVAITYKINNIDDQDCRSCDHESNEAMLTGVACKWLESISDFLHEKKKLDPSLVSGQLLDSTFKTPFSRTVMAILCQTKPGERITYAELAKRAGSPGAARAVGNIMRRNPFPIIIPCHRVVSPNGLGGYAGDVRGVSLEIKQRLLDIEVRLSSMPAKL